MCPTGTCFRPATITGESTSSIRQAFKVIDTDHDGKISGEDLRSFISATALGGDDGMIKAMMTVADENRDGYVEYEEFESVLRNERLERNGGGDDGGVSNVMEEVFRVMDEDGDGRLGLTDLRAYLGRAGLAVDDEEIKAMIGLGGGDEREGVSFHGFLAILASHGF